MTLKLFKAFSGIFSGILISQSVNIRTWGPHWYVNLCIQLMENLHHAMLWVLPTFIVTVFLTKFETCCRESKKEDYTQILSSYEDLSIAVADFLIYYFISVQSFTIFNTFTYISTLFVEDDLDYKLIIFYGGSCITIFSLLFNLIILTSSIDEAFQNVKVLKRNIIEKLRQSILTESERLELNYFKDRIDMMRPMSASGYFDIDKTTLTSMLSVR